MKFVSIDPGDSTGFAVWEDANLVYASTLDAWKFIRCLAGAFYIYDGLLSVPQLRHASPPALDPEPTDALRGLDRIVCEDWKLYPWKLENHGMDWDACLTRGYIGAIELIGDLTETPITMQGANIKSDALAGAADHLFTRPLHDSRHQNDAILHGWFYLARSGALSADDLR